MSCERNRYRKLQVYTSVYKYRIFLYHSLLETLIIVCIYLLRKREIYKNDNFYYTVVLILKTNKRQSSKVNSSRKYRRRNATHFLLLRNFFSDLWTLLNNPVQSIRKSSRRTSFQPNFSSSNNPSSIFVECRRICARVFRALLLENERMWKTIERFPDDLLVFWPKKSAVTFVLARTPRKSANRSSTRWIYEQGNKETKLGCVYLLCGYIRKRRGRVRIHAGIL